MTHLGTKREESIFPQETAPLSSDQLSIEVERIRQRQTLRRTATTNLVVLQPQDPKTGEGDQRGEGSALMDFTSPLLSTLQQAV